MLEGNCPEPPHVPSADDVCALIVCSNECVGRCGWSTTAGACVAGGVTNPDTETNVGDCYEPVIALSPF